MMNVEKYQHADLIAEVKSQFVLDWNGIHGFRHWQRVRQHGLRLGRIREADEEVIELFAWLHDSRRENEDCDRDHGARASAYAESINGKYFYLPTESLSLLLYSIEHHSSGIVSDDPTIQSCWDGDRLDLGRVGMRPSPKFLSAHAVPMIEEAMQMLHISTFSGG